MSFEKVVDSQIFGVTAQVTDTRMPVGYSASNAHTAIPNPMKGSLMWDRAMFVLNDVTVTGGATGGSFTVTVQTDAVSGYTGLPIASAAIGPNSPTVVVMDNLHQSAAAPMPTHLNIDNTAGAIWSATLTCDVVAKQYRGFLGSPGIKTSERIIMGNMIVGGADGPFTGGAGFFESTTFTLGTSGSALGMHRMRLWDNALFWAVAGVSIDGDGDVDIIAKLGGVTTTIASTGVAGALSVAGEKLALANNFYGQCPNPTEIIWTEVSAGDGISDVRVVCLAKSGRGSMSKR